MVIFEFYISKEKLDILRDLDDLTIAEHIRRAVDDYLEKKIKISSSATPRILKGGKEVEL